nr:MAG TPA: hypothetical protein [Caudoviricetes sp.]
MQSENFSGQRISSLPNHTRSSAMPYPCCISSNLRLVYVNLDDFSSELSFELLCFSRNW